MAWRVSLSIFSFLEVDKLNGNMGPKSLLKKLVTKQSPKNCPTPCKWGGGNEETAAQLYVKVKQHDQNVTLCLSCGLIVDQNIPWL